MARLLRVSDADQTTTVVRLLSQVAGRRPPRGIPGRNNTGDKLQGSRFSYRRWSIDKGLAVLLQPGK